ncbi:uncharacterized protein [Drosophila takahashii]|uniref:uncharacterized protein n=1 Tax=Drosophila takahashii TaxID=29030 RepID=UPI001CF8C71F|nr:uncharacterized protein LOC108058062 [Drosophila takahashii]
MIWLLWISVAISVLVHWLYKVNKEYCVLAFFARRLRSKDGRPLESIVPMPKGATLFANCFDLYGKDPVEVFSYTRELAARFDNSYVEYSFGLSNFHVTDAHNAGNVLSDPNLITKSMIYGFLHPFLRTDLLTATDKKWHKRRSMLARTFHFDILTQFQQIFKAESLKFIHQFEDQNECIVSLPDRVARFTLNTICETAMGVKLDEMAEKGDRYRESFQRVNEGFFKRLTNPLFWDDCLYNLFVAQGCSSVLKVVHEFSSEIIAKRRVLLEEELEYRRATQSADDDICVARNKPFAMLDTLICAEKDGLIDNIGICEEVDTLIAEGYHTTYIGLVFALLTMSLYAEEQELCYQEIQEHIEDDLSNLNIGQLNKLSYLHYFLKETMRLYPSIPMIGRQTVQETELDNGLVLPKGSQINIHVFDIHRNPKYWDCPEEFRPERFLPENCQERQPYAYIPFSAGQRNCIGQKYAMQQMKTLIVVILKQFKILPVIDPKSIVFAAAATLSFKNQIKVNLVRRKCFILVGHSCGCQEKARVERELRTEHPNSAEREAHRSSSTAMIWLLWLSVALSVLVHWIYKVNKDYCVLAFFARRVRTKDGKPPESIVPMPKGQTNFSNCFDLYGKDAAEVFNHLRQLAKKAGDSYLLYGMGFPNYNVIDAHNAANILNHPNLITKSVIYNFLHPFLRTGVLTATEKKWHTRRSMLARTFHLDILNQFQEIFKAESLKFVHQFEGQDECVVSLRDRIARFTLNSICETAMGIKLDEMAEKGDRYRANFHRIDEGFTRRISNPLYWDDCVYNLFAARDYASALKVVHEFSSEIIAKRRVLLEEELEYRRATQTADDDICVARKKRFAMLDTLICAEKDGLIDNIGICEEVDTLMAEGYDTTSIGLVFALLNMSLYAKEQELCFQEIEEHIEDDLSNLNLGQLNKLSQLNYFLKETMRLYPSIPIMGRQTIQETELDNGLILPKRCQINIHVFDIHRNPKYWDSPEEFRPERFLPENCQERHPYAYIPFSGGQRNCIGQKYAMQEMKTLLVVILKQFKILPVIDPKSIVFQTGITLRFKNEIKVKLVRRNRV